MESLPDGYAFARNERDESVNRRRLPRVSRFRHRNTHALMCAAMTMMELTIRRAAHERVSPRRVTEPRDMGTIPSRV
jgi:hypothetical protein